MYFLSSCRGQTAKTLICTKSGVSAESRKRGKKCRKVRKTALFAQKVYKECAKSAVFRTFWHSFWTRRKPHFLCRLMFLPFGLCGSTGKPQKVRPSQTGLCKFGCVWSSLTTWETQAEQYSDTILCKGSPRASLKVSLKNMPCRQESNLKESKYHPGASPLKPLTLRLLNALNSEGRGLKVRFSLATIVFETFELILCQMLSSQGKNSPSNPYPHYLVRLATSRLGFS